MGKATIEAEHERDALIEAVDNLKHEQTQLCAERDTLAQQTRAKKAN